MVKLDIPLYLKPNSFEPGAIFKFVDAGKIRTKDETGFETDVFEITIKKGDKEFVWTMNRTSQKNVASAHGKDTEKWIGKKVKLSKVEQTVFGKLKQVIYGESVEEE